MTAQASGLQIGDANGNEVLTFGSVASAVNQVKITNSATTTAVKVEATGDDTNISLNLVSKGSGSVQVNGNAIGGAASGSVLQVKMVIDSTAYSTTTTIPADNTKPQNTEGAEATGLALVFTPTNAASVLLIEFSGQVAGSSAPGQEIVALFRDTVADALAATIVTHPTTNFNTTATIAFRENANSTDARTYKIRFGPTSGTGYLTRRANEATLFNGAWYAALTVTEIVS